MGFFNEGMEENSMKKFLFIILWSVLFNGAILGSSTHAKTVPYQLSLIAPLQTSSTLDSVKGIRFNFISGINDNVSGFDFGLFNIVDGNQTGLQIGVYNSSFKTSGLQIGFINRTEYLNGLQIGILNFHNEGDLRFLPIINFSF